MSLNSPKKKTRGGALRLGLSGLAVMAAGATLAAGCLDRPVAPAEPNTSNVFVDQIRQTAIDKIDLLFVVDNSVSMADKQVILRDAVPGLVERLVSPACVDDDGNPDPGAPATGDCPAGTKREFSPIDDIHIGVITSSLGDHGGNLCNPESTQGNPTQNDRAHLLPTVRPGEGLAAFDPAGFLAWKGEATTPLATLRTDFQNHVEAAGEVGCGFEATLEAWYRFLIDPSPPMDLVVEGSDAVSTGVDQDVLNQRAAFLRPDSLVAIIMLTDENDCSVMEGGPYYPNARFGWLTAQADPNGFSKFPLASDECAADPNSECCYSCLQNDRPSGCSNPCDTARQAEFDRPNVRCFEQKRRFGIDLLYPIERYVLGLSQLEITDTQTGQPVANPLFAAAAGTTPRDPSLVFLAGIVGVPWQDIATADSLTGAGLTYLTAAEMNDVDANLGMSRWDVILGSPDAQVPPADPLMIEQIEPRDGANPVTGDALARWDANPGGNPINGHEYDNSQPSVEIPGDGLPMNDDLQYACIFPLTETRDCTMVANQAACDCATQDDLNKNKPLCEGNTQTQAKAYPGTRHLEVLQQFGDNSIVASICPKSLSGSTSDPSFGYNPAVGAIVKRLGEVLSGRCLPRELDVDPDTGLVPCSVVEASAAPLDCGAPGRAPVSEKVAPAVIQQLRDTGYCGGSAVDCDSFTLCDIVQLTGDAQTECQNSQVATTPGYCYVDPDNGAGNPVLVENCPPTERRLLRFVGTSEFPTPANNSITFVACVGKSFSSNIQAAPDAGM